MGYSFEGKKGVKITNAFQRIWDEFNREPNKICVDKGSEFYRKPMKSWLQGNNMETY